ncbi:MAG: universal stress protein [Chloroflexi bacterium]|nr:universal stress protein [Chloroflexota bacterium]
MLQRMVVGLDGSSLAETVLPYVRALAQGLGAEVTLLHVVHVPEEVATTTRHSAIVEIMNGDVLTVPEEASATGGHRTYLDQIWQHAAAQADLYLRRVAQRFASGGIVVKTATAVGDAATEIVRYADREGMDLIALATHGRSGLQRWLYGSVADKVLHAAHVPLLLVRPSAEPAELPQQIRQVVVPLDGSPLAETVLPQALVLASRLGVPVVLLRAVESVYIFGEPTASTTFAYEDLLEEVQQVAQQYLEGMAANLESLGITVQTVVPVGSPARAIITYVQDHPGSLVLMATHGRTGITHLLLGSVARRVVQHLGAPVLVVRPAAVPAPTG